MLNITFARERKQSRKNYGADLLLKNGKRCIFFKYFDDAFQRI